MPVPNITHRNIKSKNEPLLDQHYLGLFEIQERFASIPRTKGDSSEVVLVLSPLLPTPGSGT